MRRGEGDGLGEKEASRQKGAEGAVKDGGRWKIKKGVPKAPQMKNRRRRRRKNEKSAPKAPMGWGGAGSEGVLWNWMRFIGFYYNPMRIYSLLLESHEDL